jgi:hypothetical protein
MAIRVDGKVGACVDTLSREPRRHAMLRCPSVSSRGALERIMTTMGNLNFRSWSTSGLLPLLVVLQSSCCDSPRLVNFAVEPAVACPGEPIRVSWEVVGSARLAIVKGTKAPTPEQIAANEQWVKPKEDRSIPISETTTFVVRAVEANQAKDPWQGTKFVDVPSAGETKGVTTQCTGMICGGSFTIHTTRGNAKITRISDPMISQNGVSNPGKVCVTHDSVRVACIAPGQGFDVAVPAQGSWTLETTVGEAAAASPPPVLTIAVQISCP